MKVGLLTLTTALLIALPAFAGTGPNCGPVDTDSDGTYDLCDNCSLQANTQQDDDSDGYGDLCDCDFNNDNYCDGTDFLTFVGGFGKAVPPAAAVVDMNDDLYVDGTDFLLFSSGFGKAPGPACSAAGIRGNPCPGPNP